LNDGGGEEGRGGEEGGELVGGRENGMWPVSAEEEKGSLCVGKDTECS